MPIILLQSGSFFLRPVWHQPCPTAGHVLSRSTTRVSSCPQAENSHKFTHRLEMCIRLSRSPRQQSCFLIWSLQINLSARHGPGLLTARLDLSNTPCTTLRHPLNDGLEPDVGWHGGLKQSSSHWRPCKRDHIPMLFFIIKEPKGE